MCVGKDLSNVMFVNCSYLLLFLLVLKLRHSFSSVCGAGSSQVWGDLERSINLELRSSSTCFFVCLLENSWSSNCSTHNRQLEDTYKGVLWRRSQWRVFWTHFWHLQRTKYRQYLTIEQEADITCGRSLLNLPITQLIAKAHFAADSLLLAFVTLSQGSIILMFNKSNFQTS